MREPWFSKMAKLRTDPDNMTKKQITVRTILFIAAVVIAVSAFSIGVVKIGEKKEGYYTVQTSPEEEALTYANDFSLEYYCTGESNEIKQLLNELGSFYSGALNRAYKLLDPVTEYNGYVNLASVNNALGKEITVSDELFDVLTDAWKKTEEQQGFNLFGGVLYDEWQSLLILEHPEEFDPLNNPDTADRIRAAAARTASLSHFSFRVTDEKTHTVCLSVDDAYASFLAENDFTAPVVTTGLLHDAYVLRIVRSALEKEGYHNGYLTSKSGLTVSLSEHEAGEYCLYALSNGEAVEAAALPVGKNTACQLFRAFPMSEGAIGYYSPDGKHLRHGYYIAGDGTFADVIASAIAVSASGDPVEACYFMIRLNQCTAVEDAAALINASDLSVVYSLQSVPGKVYCSPAAEAKLRILRPEFE